MIHKLTEEANILAPEQPEAVKQTTSTLDKIQLLLIEYMKEKGFGLEYATEKSKEIVNVIILYNQNS